MGLFAGTQFDRPPRCPVCDALESECHCPPPEVVRTAPSSQQLRIRLERRKNGKQVTVIRGLAPDTDFLSLLKQLKARCGAGGTVDGQTLELQGDQQAPLTATLKQLGYRVSG
ncbi:MAG: translation initiation factor [Planctomycetaceae bacterium]